MLRKPLIVQLFSLFCLAWPVAAQNQGSLGDRLLLEINHNAFTQRQMEVYLTLKQVIKPRADAPTSVDQGNWHESLNQYRDDMLIYQELRRQGHFQPSKEQLKTALASVAKARQTSSPFQVQVQRLGIDQPTLLQTASDILQIEEYRRVRDKSVEKEWLKDLQRRYVVRFFKATETYQPLAPPPHREGEGGQS